MCAGTPTPITLLPNAPLPAHRFTLFFQFGTAPRLSAMAHVCTVSHSRTYNMSNTTTPQHATPQHATPQRHNATLPQRHNTQRHHHHQSPEASAAFLAELPRLAKIVKEATGADVSVVDCATVPYTAGVRCRLLVCRPLRDCCEPRSETQSIRLQVEGRPLPGPKGGQNYRERGGRRCEWRGGDKEGQRERSERKRFKLRFLRFFLPI